VYEMAHWLVGKSAAAFDWCGLGEKAGRRTQMTQEQQTEAFKNLHRRFTSAAGFD